MIPETLVLNLHFTNACNNDKYCKPGGDEAVFYLILILHWRSQHLQVNIIYLEPITTS